MKVTVKELFSRAGQYFLVLFVGNLVALFASLFSTVTRWFPVTTALPEYILTFVFSTIAMCLSCLVGGRRIGYSERAFSFRTSLFSALIAMVLLFLIHALWQFAFTVTAPAYSLAQILCFSGERLRTPVPSSQVLPLLPPFYAAYTALLVLGHRIGKKKRDKEKAALW